MMHFESRSNIVRWTGAARERPAAIATVAVNSLSYITFCSEDPNWKCVELSRLR